MRRLIIFVDHKIDYSDRVQKIKDDLKKIEVTKYYIEDYIYVKGKINNNDIIYFLTNSDLIYNVITELKQNKIINKEFYKNKFNKYLIQKRLIESKIKTPTLYNCKESIEKTDLPIFIKSKSHDLCVCKVFSTNSLKYFLSKIDEKDFYFEKPICEKDIINERKIYCVYNYIFENQTELNDTIITDLIKNIQRSLCIDVLSVDVIETDDCLYVIDVNSAPGLWNSKDARLKLGECCNGEK